MKEEQEHNVKQSIRQATEGFMERRRHEKTTIMPSECQNFFFMVAKGLVGPRETVTTLKPRATCPLLKMGQSESRDSRDSRDSRGSRVYYEGGVRYVEAPRYEVKKDTYEFWNTVDGRVRNAMGDRKLDLERTRTVQIEAPVSRIIEPPRPISTVYGPSYGPPIITASQPVIPPIQLASVPTYSASFPPPYIPTTPTYYAPAPTAYYTTPTYIAR